MFAKFKYKMTWKQYLHYLCERYCVKYVSKCHQADRGLIKFKETFFRKKCFSIMTKLESYLRPPLKKYNSKVPPKENETLFPPNKEYLS